MRFGKLSREGFSLVVFFTSLFFLPVTLLAQSISNPEVILVGTIHSFHFDPQYHYSMPDLLAEVKALKPNVVCGEIVSDAYQQDAEGYYPPEASYLAEMAKEVGYRFVASDWRGDSRKEDQAEAAMPKEKLEEIDKFQASFLNEIKTYRGVSIFDYFHSSEHRAVIDQYFERSIMANGDTVMGYWHERNRNVIDWTVPSSLCVRPQSPSWSR